MNRKADKAPCVYTIKKNGKIYRYMVRVVINYQKKYVGCFKTEEEAINAYNKFMSKRSEQNKQRSLT